MTTITVASITMRPKRSIVVTTDGRKIGVWPQQIAMFQAGLTYEVELKDEAVNGTTYTNVVKAQQVAASAAYPTQAAPAVVPQQQNGGNYYRPTAPEDAKRMFVCANLSAMIQAGKVENKKEDVWNTASMLCAVWDHMFGDKSQLRRAA